MEERKVFPGCQVEAEVGEEKETKTKEIDEKEELANIASQKPQKVNPFKKFITWLNNLF